MSKRNSKSLVHDALLGAAITGLLSAGCATTADGEDGPRKLGETRDPELTVAKFKDICEERGGLIQTHAACGGTNSCRGLIVNSWAADTIIEHTCRGFNACSGISCVDLPANSGKTGQDVYEETCMSCHGGGHDAEDASLVYTHFVMPGGDVDASLAAFNARSDAALVNIVAFGSVGYYDDGTAYSNMPAYHEELSLAEVRRVVEHIRDLEIVAEEMEVLGLNAEIEHEEGGGGGH